LYTSALSRAQLVEQHGNVYVLFTASFPSQLS
jgi:hypothetical protein